MSADAQVESAKLLAEIERLDGERQYQLDQAALVLEQLNIAKTAEREAASGGRSTSTTRRRRQRRSSGSPSTS